MAGTDTVVLSSSSSEPHSPHHNEEPPETRSDFSLSATTNGTLEPSPRSSNSKPRDRTAAPFPMNAIRRVIRSEGNPRMTQDAVFLINTAAEKFLQEFVDDAYSCAKDDHKRSLHYKHLSSVVYNKKRYEFLTDFVPEKLRAEDALSERASAGT